MALAGLHVVAGYAGNKGFNGSTQALLGRITWSETMAVAGTTATGNVAPANDQTNGMPMFRIRAAADSWVAIGAAPNATTGNRVLVPANTDYDLYATPGDRVAWIAA